MSNIREVSQKYRLFASFFFGNEMLERHRSNWMRFQFYAQSQSFTSLCKLKSYRQHAAFLLVYRSKSQTLGSHCPFAIGIVKILPGAKMIWSSDISDKKTKLSCKFTENQALSSSSCNPVRCRPADPWWSRIVSCETKSTIRRYKKLGHI